MGKQVIGVGSAANDGTGDSLRTSFTKANANFTELYLARGIAIYADDYCVGDGVTDDSTNLSSAITAAGTGGSIIFNPQKKYYFASSITIPKGVFLVGGFNPGDVQNTWNYTFVTPQLILAASKTINVNGGGGIDGFAIIRQGINLNPATVQATLTNVAAYSGTALTLSGSGPIVRDCVLLGHALGIYCTNASRFDIRKVVGDCTSGMLIDNMHDVSDIEGVTFTGQVGPASGTQSPTLAITGAANNGSGAVRLAMADTSTLLTGNKVWVAGVTGTTEANNTWTITVVDSTHVDLVGSTFSHAYVSGGTLYLDTTYRSGIGFEVTNSENPRFVNCFSYGHQTGWHFGTGAGWVNCINCGSDGNNAAKDPTTTSILMDSTSYGLSWMGGWTSSHGAALSFSSSSTLQSAIVGCSFNANGGNSGPFSITSGSLSLTGCTGRTAGTFTLGSGITRVLITGCDFSSSTLSNAAPSKTLISNSNFNGSQPNLLTITADGAVVHQ